MWATNQYLWKAALCLFPYNQQNVSNIKDCAESSWSLIIFSYDQQSVSDITHFMKGSLMTSYDKQKVNDIEVFVGNLITSFPLPNRKWVILDILWKGVSSHLFLWPTVCQWHCTFCERHSHLIFSYNPQLVSNIAHFVKNSLITFFLWPTGSE